VLSWLYDRPTDVTERWIAQKFGDTPVAKANLAAFRAGWSFGETAELIDVQVTDNPIVDVEPGTYRNINGTEATALGLIAASVKARLPLVFGAYPITPASDLLHSLARRQDLGVRTMQAEDEIAAASFALGAAFGGSLGVTCTSGPGLDLKTETIGLAVILELPMVIIDVQRAGPSTGMPTKTEQSDLLQALHGRHGESPLPVVAAQSPGQCFDAVYEAVQIAVTYRTPVILLSDLFLANSSEPWRIPSAAALEPIDPRFRSATANGTPFLPYARDDNLARPWAIPGTKGLQHRIGGLEKLDGTGAISYDGPNHQRMTELREAKVKGVEVPDLVVNDNVDADLLVLGWGSSYGTIRAGARRVQERGGRVATAHLRHLHPLPANLGEVLRSYERVLVPEMNSGQLAHELRARYLIDVETYAKVQGQPLLPSEMEQEIWRRLSS
jgi:2-oxoglutarate ferredoxin oxidoreductase subunit alpha